MSGPELNVQLGEVGKRIMEQRKRMGLTQKELAEKSGIQRSMFPIWKQEKEQ